VEKWVALNREQAWASRDFSRAGEIFIDHNGQVNEILYSILTPLGYQVYVSTQKLQHIEKHPIAVKHKNDVVYILSNPDLVTLNPEFPNVHIFYKSFSENLLLEKMEIRIVGGVVEFIFGPSKRIVFNDEDQPGLEVGRDKRSRKIVAYMSIHFPGLYRRILKGLKEKPIAQKFSVEVVEDYENVTPICDPRVKNATLAEIVQWVWEKYYAHLETPARAARPAGKSLAAETTSVADA